MLVKDIYKKHPGTIHAETTIQEALRQLLQKDFNGFLVVNDNDDLVGVLSLQDILNTIVPMEFRDNLNLADAMYKPHFFAELCAKAKFTKVANIMQTDFLTITPETTVMKVAADFLNRDMYTLPIPVLENGKVVGIVTRSEIKKALAHGMDISA